VGGELLLARSSYVHRTASVDLELDIDANHVLQVEIQSVGGAKLAARRFDLRRDGGSFRADGNQVPHLDDLLMPSWPKCVQIAHIAGQMGDDASTVQRWICRTATDLVLELVGPGARGGWWKDLTRSTRSCNTEIRWFLVQ
jgi:hypothetical protein